MIVDSRIGLGWLNSLAVLVDLVLATQRNFNYQVPFPVSKNNLLLQNSSQEK